MEDTRNQNHTQIPIPTTRDSYSIEDFDYDLPPELIAQKPLSVRHDSRLLHVDRATGALAHHHFKDLPAILKTSDVLIVNDTKVLPSRLYAKRDSGGTIRLLLLQPDGTRPTLWLAMVSPIKRLKPGEELTVERMTGSTSQPYKIKVVDIVHDAEGFKRLLVDLGQPQDVFSLLSEIGYAPLPPYIHREAELTERVEDLNQYQTVFAREPGAVAAPTAGLHFSDGVLSALKAKGVLVGTITLHVGPGTFKPISASIDEHHIEPERYSIPQSTADLVNQALAEGRRVIPVGTTALRAVESACANYRLKPVDSGTTALYIKPGHDFQIAKGLITNFHLSRSSLLVLVSTFAGRDLIMRAYKEAIAKQYRFFSYGDAMLLL